MTPPEPEALGPEPGWSALTQGGLPQIRSFVSGEPDGDRVRARYYHRASDGCAVGKVWFGPGAEGPPGHVHGGAMAAILDEAMGLCAWINGHSVLAVEVTIRFKHVIPLGALCTIETWVDRVEDRKVWMAGRLVGGGGELYCESSGMYLELKAERLGEVLAGD